MLKDVFIALGDTVEIFSSQGQKTGETHARISLLKSNARVLYNDKVFETGSFSNETFSYVGATDNGGDTVTVGSTLICADRRFLVVSCERRTLNSMGVVWAVLKRLPEKEVL